MDANVLVAGAQHPRLAYEVLQAGVRDRFHVVLPEQVIEEARRHSFSPAETAFLEELLAATGYEESPMPLPQQVAQNQDLVRSAKDVPIALALLEGNGDIFVTGDRDFSDPGATAQRFSESSPAGCPIP